MLFNNFGSDIKTLEHNLEFIINKCLKSTHEDVVTLGETLLSWSTELLNAYSDKNIYGISNGIAESFLIPLPGKPR